MQLSQGSCQSSVTLLKPGLSVAAAAVGQGKRIHGAMKPRAGERWKVGKRGMSPL